MKACISYISYRARCLEHSLGSLWSNYNHKHDYPVYVYYFDDIYDSLEFRKGIHDSCPQNVIFKSIPYNTPPFIREQDLFYNRNLWYAKNSFSIYRKGYLHMCNFTSNMYGYPNTDFHLYDYIMTHDDEAGYTKEMTYDPFEVMKDRPESMGCYDVRTRLKNEHPHQGHLDTRVGLWDFTKNFLVSNDIIPKSEVLLSLLNDPAAERNYHYIKWCDTYVIKTEMFKSALWKKWINAVNESGGIYKYRWGDNEIITLFAYIYEENIYDLQTVDDGYHNQGMFRHMQNYAPGVKDLLR